MTLRVEAIRMGSNGRMLRKSSTRRPWRKALRFAWRSMRAGDYVRVSR